ncbi:hypothetical protein EXIGLDRAFT_837831 [Exidia glandulosa HHB12029]|uniref:Fe2OG dioxygenase domain-containing protein n=1 Tax=Exidia glandulosa HHB12029 TaxID=1314781 RepID=A0A165GF71_EXIGL|nr:hypothetical protein EXIGLDRAFT_837831 [Exidia glandulosa HHB12029]
MSTSTVTESQRAVLTDALVEPKPFFGDGVWSFPRDQFNLFLDKEPFRVNLSKDAASEADLQKLAAACDAATFGMDQKDVLDESYRKAGKLDKADFGLNLDIVSAGLLQAVQNALFGWEDQPRNIKAELYKLNVYGPGSFFKAHKDTPRGDDMFGSLVLNFPTKHEGGALVLRHDGREHVHDASAAAYTSPEQVSWVAFYSDVEHEVLPVKSGHRITLTYNLYFTEGLTAVPSLPSIESLQLAFQNVLKDETFFPAGGRLGFGLKHQYPVPTKVDWKQRKKALQDLSHVLKGGDRAIFHTAHLLGLQPKLAMAYNFGRTGVYLLDSVYSGDGQVDSWAEEMEWRKAELVEPYIPEPDHYSYEYYVKAAKKAVPVEWIVPYTSSTRVESHFVAYGNEASLSSIYGDLVMIVTVPEKSKRQV